MLATENSEEVYELPKKQFRNIKIDPDDWEKLVLRWTKLRIHVDNGCISFEGTLRAYQL